MNGLEIIDMDNPLLLPLGAYVDLVDWADVLAVDPLEGVDCANLSGRQRDMLLSQIRHVYEPTSPHVSIVATMQTMLWRRCTFANPRIPQNRASTMKVLAQRGKGLTDAPWLPTFADAFMVMGCTGLGKSTAALRLLLRLVQFYEHPRRDDAEWTRHVQITYLIVSMPVHRGGLLYAILATIDNLIGTSYRVQYGDGRSWPIEKLAIEVAIILAQHHVGLLVIEEIQARNFSRSPNRDEMLLFILRVLNFGTPVVLIGNPMGFDGVLDFAQDLNRLTENEPIHLMPLELGSEDWHEGLGPAMWGHNVMPVATPWSTDVSSELHSCSAGFPGYSRKAAEGVQRIGMRIKGCQSVDVAHLRRYREESGAYRANLDLLEGFRLKDPFKLMKYLDVPWEAYGLLWGKLDLEDIMSADDADDAVDAKVDAEGKDAYRSIHRQLRATAKAQVTRKKAKSEESRAKKTRTGVSGQGLETQLGLVAGLDALRQSLSNNPRAKSSEVTTPT